VHGGLLRLRRGVSSARSSKEVGQVERIPVVPAHSQIDRPQGLGKCYYQHVMFEGGNRMATVQEEYDWLVAHHKEAEKHPGRWIAILGGRIVADGRSFSEAHRKATKEHGSSIPLVLYVPKKNEELLIL